jgi:glutamate/tyrosine decarboxylase-like PLP-dependent enzyme
MHYLGVEGYRAKAKAVTDTREHMLREISAIGGLAPVGEPRLGLFAYGSFGADALDIYAVWGRMLKRGWFTGLLTEPRAIHLMLSPAHADFADDYLADLRRAVAEVRETGATAADTRARYS